MLELAACGLSVLGSGGPWCLPGQTPTEPSDAFWAPGFDRGYLPATAAWSSRWSWSFTCAHAVVVSVLTPAETLIAARRLAGARPHLAAVACLVHHDDLWQLCRDELTGVGVRADGWDIRGRWFGVVVGATPRTGELPGGDTIPWRVIAAQIAPPERRSMR
jgi:hypothetical protein